MDHLLLEIGSEEIPPGYIKPALDALCSNLLQKLTDTRIEHGRAQIFGTPRRLAVKVENVALKQKSLQTELIGPPARIGFDGQGKPTMAAKKFAEKAGTSVETLKVKKTEKGDYLCAQKTERGRSTRILLQNILPEVILSAPFPKTMRWADLDIEFARPIHSILALLGTHVIGFKLGNIKSDRYTVGHSFMRSEKIKMTSADDYNASLRDAYVYADILERRKIVEQQIRQTANQLGGSVLPDEDLVDIVTNLVEYPVAVAGKFDAEFLEVPDEVLINAMREHQKYFAVVDKKKKLMPCFVAVNNTCARDMGLVAKGHERVLRARLADAQFFYNSDLDVSNDERIEKLKRVLFQAKLGTLYEKAERISRLGEVIAAAVDLGVGDIKKGNALNAQVERAAKLCKADLVSQVVVEFPKLQGIMGRVYATVGGEPPTVAAAIEEHYRPVYSGAPLPETTLGAILSIADKVDSICGCFNVGLIPTGASDPYALRRQGIGIIQIALDKRFTFSLSKLLEESLKLFKSDNRQAVKEQVYTFLQNRMTHLFVDDGFSKDTIAAVLNVASDNIPETRNRVQALEKLKAKPDFEPLAIAFKRVVNIIKKADDFQAANVDPKLFEHESETALMGAYTSVKKKVEDDLQKGFFDQALVKIASLRETVDAFFEAVMVMTEDEKVRRNRLSLLGQIAALFGKFADFSKLSTQRHPL